MTEEYGKEKRRIWKGGKQMKTKQPKAVHQKSFWKRCVEHRALILMSLPGLAAVFIFSYIPMYGILIAFQNYNPVDGMFAMNNWVGLKYFKQFLSNPYLFRLIRNTLLLGIYTLLWSFPAPIIFALLMDQLTSAKFKKAVQSISYMPYFISTVVIVGLVKSFCSVDGVINVIREAFGWAGHFLYDRSQVLQDHLHCQQYLAGTWMGSYRIPGSAFRSRSPAS